MGPCVGVAALILGLVAAAQPAAAGIEGLERSVVKIKAKSARGTETGAGFVVDANDQRVVLLTAFHVVHARFEDDLGETWRPAETIEVVFIDDVLTTHRAEVFKHDEALDLAILVVRRSESPLPSALPAFRLGNIYDLDVNDPVLAIGHPANRDWQVSREALIARVDPEQPDRFLITQTMIVRGNSGGPALDLDGGLIGMVSRLGRVKDTQVIDLASIGRRLEGWRIVPDWTSGGPDALADEPGALSEAGDIYMTVSVSSGNDPNFAIDDDLSTVWYADGPFPQWIQFELDEPQLLTRIIASVAQTGWAIHVIYLDGMEGHMWEGNFADGQVLEFELPFEMEVRTVRIQTDATDTEIGWREIAFNP